MSIKLQHQLAILSDQGSDTSSLTVSQARDVLNHPDFPPYVHALLVETALTNGAQISAFFHALLNKEETADSFSIDKVTFNNLVDQAITQLNQAKQQRSNILRQPEEQALDFDKLTQAMEEENAARQIHIYEAQKFQAVIRTFDPEESDLDTININIDFVHSNEDLFSHLKKVVQEKIASLTQAIQIAQDDPHIPLRRQRKYHAELEEQQATLDDIDATLTIIRKVATDLVMRATDISPELAKSLETEAPSQEPSE